MTIPPSNPPANPPAPSTEPPAAVTPTTPGGSPARGGPTDPSHDQELRRGILHTDVSRTVAAALTGVFLLVIAAVPTTQVVLERIKGDESVFPDLFARWPTQESIKQFEEDLEKASYAREGTRPRLQYALTKYGQFGNEKAVVGRDGWLFYQPGVAAVGGPPLLDPTIRESRARAARDSGGETLYPDPRPAILDLHAYLADRRIRLILFPVPDKAGLQPAELHGRTGAGAGNGEGASGDGRRVTPGRNPDHPRLMAELAQAGVLIFDPTPAALEPGESPRFLKQDTHWTPAWMGEVAAELAAYVRAHVALDAAADSRWRAVPKSVSRVGDVVDMLGLLPTQALFAPQTVTVLEVHGADGALFEPVAQAQVLLLGDSFCNVFTLAQMGWGEAAGLAPQLARALGADVDVIAQNDAGAFATRRLLWNELSNPEGGAAAGAPDRLTGKKAVIWEFASRELAVGNWKPLVWPRRTTAPAPGGAP